MANLQKIPTFFYIYKCLKTEKLPIKPYDGMNDTEWINFLNTNGVIGLCNFAINPRSGETGDFANLIKKEYLKYLMLNAKRENEALKIILKLNEYGIKPIVLKGLYLQKFIYKEGEIRRSDDIDLYLWDDKEETICKSVIESLGYHKYEYQSKLWEKCFSKGVTYLSSGTNNSFSIDLHRHLLFNTHDLRSVYNDIFERQEIYEEAYFNKGSIRIMKKEAVFSYLLFHHFKIHTLLRFLDLYDLLTLVRDHSINFEIVKIYASELKIQEELETVLKIIEAMVEDKPYETNFIKIESLSFPNNFMFKLKNIRGFWLKIIWLYTWLFPSERFLESLPREKKNAFLLRIEDLWYKLKGVFIKIVIRGKDERSRR